MATWRWIGDVSLDTWTETLRGSGSPLHEVAAEAYHRPSLIPRSVWRCFESSRGSEPRSTRTMRQTGTF